MYPHAQSFTSRIVKAKSQPKRLFESDIPASSRGPYRQYDSESMKLAIGAVEHGLSIRRAAEKYGVKPSTLQNYVAGKVQYGARSGPKPYLTSDEEMELVIFLLKCARIGYGFSKKRVLGLVQQIVDSKGIDSTVTNGWWERFCGRNPQVTLKSAVPLSYARAMATDPEVIEEYYNILEDTLRSNTIFDKPGNIFNLDETGMPLCPSSPKVVDKVGSKNTSYLTGNTKAQITVLACVSAAGYAIPPFVIFDRKTLNPQYTYGEVPGTLYGLSQNGWIDMVLFSEWFFHHFLSYAPSVRPLLLIVDGHSSHYCPEVIRAAAAEQVLIYVLPPNTTHLCQPLDKGCFSPLKSRWREVCHKYIANNPGCQVTRHEFSKLFSEAWYQAMTMSNIVSSFKVTGICPFNRNAISLPVGATAPPEVVSLAKKTGLAYIPLYSPCIPRSKPVIRSPSSGARPVARALSDSELNISQCESPVHQYIPPLKTGTTISKFLIKPQAPSKIPVKCPKSSGRVLTSKANIEAMEAKEAMKKEAAKAKEERKRAREEKKAAKMDKKQKCASKSKASAGSCDDSDLSDYVWLESTPLYLPENDDVLDQSADDEVASSRKKANGKWKNSDALGQPADEDTRSRGRKANGSLDPSNDVPQKKRGRSKQGRRPETDLSYDESVGCTGSRGKKPNGNDVAQKKRGRAQEDPNKNMHHTSSQSEDESMGKKVNGDGQLEPNVSCVSRARSKKGSDRSDRGAPRSRGKVNGQLETDMGRVTRARSKNAPEDKNAQNAPEDKGASGSRGTVIGQLETDVGRVTRARCKNAPVDRGASRSRGKANGQLETDVGHVTRVRSKDVGPVTRARSKKSSYVLSCRPEDEEVGRKKKASGNLDALSQYADEADNSRGRKANGSLDPSTDVPQKKRGRSKQGPGYSDDKGGSMCLQGGDLQSGGRANKGPNISDGDECVTILDSAPDPVIVWWVNELYLLDTDKRALQSGEDLSDAVINAAQRLLKSQFPNTVGFQNTQLGEKFKPLSRESKSVQILNTGTFHWICVACTEGKISVLDSLGFTSLGESAIIQIAKLFPPNTTALCIERLSVQQQNGYHDCGLFAVAFALEICRGRNPELALYDQDKMRDHLVDCLSGGLMKDFPTLKSRDDECIPRPKRGTLSIKVFCQCKMPARFDANMIQCETCEEWFHFSCMKIDPSRVPKHWDCPRCYCIY